MKLPKKFRMIVVSAAMALSVAAVHAQDQSRDPRSINPIPPNSSTNAGASSGLARALFPPRMAFPRSTMLKRTILPRPNRIRTHFRVSKLSAWVHSNTRATL